ncbi:hypothetical protein [Deinococcus pimensis]|uniref:hypothetical protein n=1 Tax=Deinococcus pimensis TaxID=309888 RepID=UPI0012F7CF84|nr:hypothetical protein [Deinococcus pimensis]
MRHLLLALALLIPSVAGAQRSFEYAVLYVNKTTGYAWETPRGVVGPDPSLRSFAAKLRCQGETLGAILNCVGRDGWELTGTYVDPTQARGIQALMFKRER